MRRLAHLVATFVLGSTATVSAQANRVNGSVNTIDWSTYDTSIASNAATGSLLRDNQTILLNNTRYNYRWTPGYHNFEAANSLYRPKGVNESEVRPGAMAAYGMATVLRTGTYNSNPGLVTNTNGSAVTQQQLTVRTAQLIKGLAAHHKANNAATAWGDQWQSALWAGLVGNAGWMMWDDLDTDARTYVQRMVTHEANRFVEPGYIVPYWNGVGGDSKAEENAWNAMIHQVGVAMMPNHVHANEWKRVGSELLVSAYSRPSDRTNARVIDGRPVQEWLKGYNIREDGITVNHDLIHPDYTVDTNISQRGFLTQSLAGQVVSEAAKFNGDVVWQALTEVSFKAGDVVLGKTIQQPGGTMYIPGSGAIYYPHGSEASATRRDMFYLTDAFAHVLDLERANPAFSAEQWMRLRAQDMLAMQARHADGHLYAPGEHSSWAATEQMPSWQMSDAYLAVWLDAQNKVSPEGNWIPHVFVENPGFEKVNLSAGTLKRFNVTGGIDGWQLLSGDGQKAGVTNFAGHGVVGAAFDEARFNGNHKALWINANGGTVPPVIGQALGVAIDDDLRYVLSLDIASLGEAGNGIESYVVQLLADGVLLSEAVEGINGAPTLLDGRFVTVSLDFDASAGLPAGVVPGVSALQLRLINPVMYSGPLSAQTIFDNVRLTAVPVPEPVSSIGVACLALRRRRTV